MGCRLPWTPVSPDLNLGPPSKCVLGYLLNLSGAQFLPYRVPMRMARICAHKTSGRAPPLVTRRVPHPSSSSPPSPRSAPLARWALLLLPMDPSQSPAGLFPEMSLPDPVWPMTTTEPLVSEKPDLESPQGLGLAELQYQTGPPKEGLNSAHPEQL